MKLFSHLISVHFFLTPEVRVTGVNWSLSQVSLDKVHCRVRLSQKTIQTYIHTLAGKLLTEGPRPGIKPTTSCLVAGA